MPFETVRESLLKGGIAPRRVRRYLGELNDHLAELTDDQRRAGYTGEDAAIRARALLGGDAELAEAWLADPRLKSLTARAPWLMFLMLPPIALVLVMFLPTLLLVVLAKTHHFLTNAALPPYWYRLLGACVVNSSNLVAGPLVAALFVLLARRQRLRSGWPLAAITLMVLLVVHMKITFADVHHARGSLSVGAGLLFQRDTWRLVTAQWPLTIARWVLTLSPIGWYVLQQRKTRA